MPHKVQCSMRSVSQGREKWSWCILTGQCQEGLTEEVIFLLGFTRRIDCYPGGNSTCRERQWTYGALREQKEGALGRALGEKPGLRADVQEL